MELTRRKAMILGTSVFMVSGFPRKAKADTTDDPVAAFTGGADIGAGDITLTAPEIAENGNNVLIEVSAPGAVEIAILALSNPRPNVATFRFGKLAASQSASTRIRLAESQDVIAIAKLGDGSFVQASSSVRVTIGGCGG